MAIDLSALGETVRRVYDKKVADGVYSQSPLFSYFDKETAHVQPGESARINIFTGYGAGESNLAEGGTHNTPTNNTYSTASYSMKRLVIPVRISGDAIGATQSPDKAAFKAVEQAMQRATEAAGLANERQIFNDQSSILAKCGSTTTSTTVQLDVNGVDYDGKQAIARGWLYPGRKVDIGVAADEDSVVASTTISAVDETNGTITIGSSVSTDTSTFVYAENSRSGSTSYEMNGLNNLVDATGTVGGIAYSAGKFWQSPENTDTALTLANIRLLERQVMQSVGVAPTVFVVGFKQAAKLQALGETQIQWADQASVKFGDAFSGRVQIFDGKEVLVRHNCPDHMAYLLTPKDFVLIDYGNGPQWGLPGRSADTTFQWDLTSENLVASIRHYRELGVRRRCTSGKFTTLTAA